MNLAEVLSKARQGSSDLKPPATPDDLQRLESKIGTLPEDVLRLFRDHNGSNYVRSARERKFVARLMPI
jgi:cell wall assembly regulator SMI1